jgi:hypothetical protein
LVKDVKENIMCFGPSKAEKQLAADSREESDLAKREQVEARATQKREDITEAIEGRTERRGMRGGSGRRSLFRASGSGFLGRFK